MQQRPEREACAIGLHRTSVECFTPLRRRSTGKLRQGEIQTQQCHAVLGAFDDGVTLNVAEPGQPRRRFVGFAIEIVPRTTSWHALEDVPAASPRHIHRHTTRTAQAERIIARQSGRDVRDNLIAALQRMLAVGECHRQALCENVGSTSDPPMQIRLKGFVLPDIW